MNTRIHTGAIAATILAAIAGSAADARAQVRQWTNPNAGNWNVPSNWTPNDIPDSGTENATFSVVGAYTVTMPSGYSATVEGITIAMPFVTVARNDSGNLIVLGNIFNHGELRIGSQGGGGTYLQTDRACHLGGNGIIRLNANPANLDTGVMFWLNNATTNYYVQEFGHSIKGVGNIYARLDSAGGVDADVAGGTLQLTSQNKTNTGTMQASAGTLRFSGIGITNTGGNILSTGGTVMVSGSSIHGGGLANSGGTVTFNGASTIGSVTTSGPIQVEDSANLYISTPGIVNNGSITLNTGVGNNQTLIRALGGVNSLSGSGSLVLNATTNLDTAAMYWNSNSVTETFSQTLGHTIRGTGQVYVGLENSGLVNADQNGRVLRLSSQTKSNTATGTMRASNGGILEISGITVNNTGGVEALTGSIVQLSSAVLSGGTLTSSGTGFTRASGTSYIGGLTLNCPVRVTDGSDLRGFTSLTNNNLLTVNETSGANQTSFRAYNGTLALAGTGSILLNATANLDTAIMVWNSNSVLDVIIQEAGHSIRGSGNVYIGLTNNGLVHADQAAKTLQLTSQGKTNNGTFRASNGGLLAITSITVTNNATVEALANSVVQLSSAGIVGGTLSSSGSGLFRIIGNSSIASLSNSAPMFVQNAALLYAGGTINNSNTITVSDGSGNNATSFRAVGSVALNGSGNLLLNATNNLDTAFIQWNSHATNDFITQGAAHTIRGTGNVYVSLINNGLVNADQSGKILQLTSQGKTNNGTLRASNGGQLAISSITLTNNATVEALTGSVVQLNSAGISGGTLGSSGTGLFRTTGNSSIAGLSNSAPIHITNGSHLYAGGVITNSGTITVSDGTGSGSTGFRPVGSTVLDGSGTLMLNATANFDTAIAQWNSNAVTDTLTQNSGHTFAGNGNIYVRLINSGILSPGVTIGSAGRLNFGSQPAQLNATSRYVCNINGTAAAQYDRLTGSASIVLNGTLAVQFGYQPNISDQFDVVGAPYTGRFTRLELPKGYYVEYLPSIVRVIFSGCMGDWDQDGDVDSDDVNLFFADFENGESDIDNDGDTDSDDIIEFFGRFESGC